MSDSSITIAVLKEKVRAFCVTREWDEFHGAKDLAIGIITEASELLEHFRFKSQPEVEELLTDKEARTLISDEIGDIMFFLVRFCQRYKFDLATALNAKIEKNEVKYPVDKARGSNKKYTEL
jgi:NTP pyrophosphatase (non-canonical NTP hydrolase)